MHPWHSLHPLQAPMPLLAPDPTLPSSPNAPLTPPTTPDGLTPPNTPTPLPVWVLGLWTGTKYGWDHSPPATPNAPTPPTIPLMPSTPLLAPIMPFQPQHSLHSCWWECWDPGLGPNVVRLPVYLPPQCPIHPLMPPYAPTSLLAPDSPQLGHLMASCSTTSGHLDIWSAFGSDWPASG